MTNPKGISSESKGFKKGLLLRADAIGIIVESDTGSAHHESVCTLGSEDYTHCSYGCTESDLFLDGVDTSKR